MSETLTLLDREATAAKLGMTPRAVYVLNRKTRRLADEWDKALPSHPFPAPVYIGRRMFWIESELDAWIAAMATERPL